MPRGREFGEINYSRNARSNLLDLMMLGETKVQKYLPKLMTQMIQHVKRINIAQVVSTCKQRTVTVNATRVIRMWNSNATKHGYVRQINIVLDVY